MIDLKVLHAVLGQLEEERGIGREQVIGTIEAALATAYKKEYGNRSQIVTSRFNPETGDMEFFQVKHVIDKESVVWPDEEGNVPDQSSLSDDEKKPVYNPEQHLQITDAQKIKKDVKVGDELTFPLTPKADFGRIASQTAKQVIMQKLREAERDSMLREYGERAGEILTGTVQRFERGQLHVDLGRATAIIPWDEQIPGERFEQGERVRAYLYRVDNEARGSFLRLSRTHPMFLQKLFEQEVPEIGNGIVEVMAIAREPGKRSKIAVVSHDEHIDPVGSLVGQHGTRVKAVMQELAGEKIDIIEWDNDPADYIADALSPAEIEAIEIDEENERAKVIVSEDQQSLAIGRGGQNVRLAARLTGWRIDITREDADTDEHKKEDTSPTEETANVEAEDITGPVGGIDESPEIEEEIEDAIEDSVEEAEENKQSEE